MLGQTLDVNIAVTPGQLSDMMEMFVTLLYLRKVGLRYWLDVGAQGMRGIALAQRIQAEANLAAVPGIDENAKKLLSDCIKVSVQEINDLRRSLVTRMEVIRQMPLPGTVLH